MLNVYLHIYIYSFQSPWKKGDEGCVISIVANFSVKCDSASSNISLSIRYSYLYLSLERITNPLAKPTHFPKDFFFVDINTLCWFLTLTLFIELVADAREQNDPQSWLWHNKLDSSHPLHYHTFTLYVQFITYHYMMQCLMQLWVEVISYPFPFLVYIRQPSAMRDRWWL